MSECRAEGYLDSTCSQPAQDLQDLRGQHKIASFHLLCTFTYASKNSFLHLSRIINSNIIPYSKHTLYLFKSKVDYVLTL